MAELTHSEEVLVLRMYNNSVIAMGYTNIHRIASIVNWREVCKKYGESNLEGAIENLHKKGLVDYHGKSRRQVVSLTGIGVAYARGLDKVGKYPDEKLPPGFRILKRG